MGPLEALKKVVDEMSTEDRQALRQAGVVVPSGDISQLATGDFTWGLRCTHCNQIALYFVGDSWEGHGGQRHDRPPAVPHREIMWTQLIPPDQIDRNEPRCQHCGVTLPLMPNGAFATSRNRIQRVADFEASRDKSRDPSHVRETVKKLTAETGQYSAEMSANYDLRSATGPVSKVIEARMGQGSLDTIEKVAEATGLTKALSQGFK